MKNQRRSRRRKSRGGSHFSVASCWWGGAVWVYIDLTNFEAEGGQRRMQWIIALVYKVLGKWGIVVLMVVGGLGAILYGVSQLYSKLSGGDEEPPPRRKKKRERLEEDDE